MILFYVEFDYCSNNDYDLISFTLKKAFSNKELSRIINGYTDINLKNIYDKIYEVIIHDTPIVKLLSSIKYCKKCNDMKMGINVRCPDCHSILVKKCKQCSLTETTIKSSTASLCCNCLNNTPNNSLAFPADGLICSLHASGLIESCVMEPSAQLF